VQQGGPIDLARSGSANLLPLELEEALEAQRPVMMEYLDARGSRTHRAIKPLHVRRAKGELLLIAHCHLREDRRTFKLDRIVRLTRLEEGVAEQAIAAGVEACVEPDETAMAEPELFQDR
jgi:predicted DNA-binding transcriptional regulator YafY